MGTEEEYRERARRILGGFFSKGKTEKIKEKERSIQVVSAVNQPVKYMVLEGAYERRDMSEECKATRYSMSTAPCKKYVRDYPRWGIRCPECSSKFSKENYKIILPDSVYVEQCYSCGAKGEVPCQRCQNGRETCPGCGGSRWVCCGKCGGSGEVQCSWCGGYGYTTRTVTVFYDEHHAIDEQVREICTRCGGRKTETCGKCGGSGSLTCGTCQGAGNIVCRECHGREWVTCSNCYGGGYFTNSVVVQQKYDNYRVFEITEDYRVDGALFSMQLFDSLAPSAGDRILSETVRDGVIDSISIGGRDTADLLARVKGMLAGDDTERFLAFRLREMEREVLCVEYKFGSETYHAMMDTQTEQLLMDRNPYESVAWDLMKELKTYVSEGKYKSFVQGCEDFERITQEKNVKYSADDIKLLKMNVLAIFYLIAVAGSLLGALIFAKHTLIYLVLAVAVAAAGTVFVMKKMWQKVLMNEKIKQFAIYAAMGLGVGIFSGRFFYCVATLLGRL